MNASHVYEPAFEIVSKNRRFVETGLFAASAGKNWRVVFAKGLSLLLDCLPLCASPRIISAECVVCEAEHKGGFAI